MGRGIAKDIEDFPKRMRVFVLLVLLTFICGTLGFTLLTGENIRDTSFRTLETLAFIYEDDVSSAERILEIFLSIFGGFSIWWVLWSIADLMLEGHLVKYIKGTNYMKRVRKMKDHVIIVGGGRVGGEVARVLKSKKKGFIIIDSDQKIVNELRKAGNMVIKGDALDENILKEAGIERASKIVLTLPKTESNIMMSLNAKELNPKIDIHSRCEDKKMVSKLKKVGAKVVIMPEIVAADIIAGSLGD